MMFVRELHGMRTAALSEILQADILIGTKTAGFSGVSTDSRTAQKGELFFAISGERFDGHDFLKNAMRTGICGAVVSKDINISEDMGNTVVFKVNSTTEALGRLAHYVREARREVTVIGITGSNGKTTTKEFVYAALSSKVKTSRSPGNFNNRIGVPVSIFNSDPGAEILIIEMGTSAPGEIASLAGIARPDIVLVTNVGDTHLEYLKNREGVAQAKAEIYETLSEGGIGVVNMDDAFAEFFITKIKGRTVSYGIKSDADISGEIISSNTEGFVIRVNNKWKVLCGVSGEHNGLNLLGALAVCCAAGYRIEEFISCFEDIRIPSMRMEKEKIQGVLYYNDAYNANPQSMRAGIVFMQRAVLEKGCRKILVCGDMKELGPKEEQFHSEVGSLITGNVADVLITVGELGCLIGRASAKNSNRPQEIIHCANVHDARKTLSSIAKQGDMVYIKASRSVGLERILEVT